MEYDYRKGGSGRGSPQFGASASSNMYGRTPYMPPSYNPHNSYYPSVSHSPVGPPPITRPPPVPSSSSPSGTGIRVSIKPEYRITAPPQLSPQIGEIPRSTFQYDFEFERKVLAELLKDQPDWSKLVSDVAQPKSSESSSVVYSSEEDRIINKYVTMGLNREAVSLALANFGDNQNKIQEFITSYNLLREMGFPSHTVASVLAMYDNDRDKALAHFLGSAS